MSGGCSFVSTLDLNPVISRIQKKKKRQYRNSKEFEVVIAAACQPKFVTFGSKVGLLMSSRTKEYLQALDLPHSLGDFPSNKQKKIKETIPLS
jgi:hypothetical protein